MNGNETMPSMLWRADPPTAAEVRDNPWWWNQPPVGPAHVMLLDLNVDDEQMFVADSNGMPFDAKDWPGLWAPCVPPSITATIRAGLGRAQRRFTRAETATMAPLEPRAYDERLKRVCDQPDATLPRDEQEIGNIGPVVELTGPPLSEITTGIYDLQMKDDTTVRARVYAIPGQTPRWTPDTDIAVGTVCDWSQVVGAIRVRPKDDVDRELVCDLLARTGATSMESCVLMLGNAIVRWADAVDSRNGQAVDAAERNLRTIIGR